MQILEQCHPLLDKTNRVEGMATPMPYAAAPSPSPLLPMVCEISEIDVEGYAVIHYEQQARRADSLVAIHPEHIGQRCLAIVPVNHQSAPIILGLLWQPNAIDHTQSHQVLEASDSLTLICGKSSLTLEADGAVRLQGVTVTTQAYGANRIKGAAVKIN